MKKPKTLQEWFTSASRWCQHQKYEEQGGKVISKPPEDPAQMKACCLGGALEWIHGRELYCPISQKLCEEKICDSIPAFNDSHAFADILPVAQRIDELARELKQTPGGARE